MEATAPPQPAPELAHPQPPESKPAEAPVPVVIAKGGDPEDGGEIAGGGAIGIGSIGTVGAGRGGGQRNENPAVTIGQVKMAGDGTLDGAIVRRYLRRNQTKFLYCYEKELRSNPALAGSTQLAFTITGDGAVSGAHGSSGIASNVEQCVLTVMAQIEFPKPKGGAVTATFPLRFSTQP
jgi:hypothetical protein